MADRKISDLAALTTPAAGDYLPIVDISEVAAVDKNKRITIEELMRGAPDGTSAAPSIAFESDGGNGLYLAGTDTIGLSTNGSSRVTISTTAFSSTLPVSLPLASASAPSLTFTGDLNTGTFSPAADTWAVSTGGTERLRIDSTGQIEANGLGSAAAPTYSWFSDPDSGLYSPGANQVAISTNGTQRINIEDDGDLILGNATNYAFVRPWEATTGNLIIGTDQSATGTGGSATIFRNRGTERLRITSTGLVGIGTSAPGSLLTVQASGTQQALFSARANAGTGGGMVLQTDASDDGLFRLYDSAGAIQVQLDTDGGDNYIALGKVGIGTTSPTRLFHALDSANTIVGRIESGQSSSWLQFAASGNGTASRIGSPDGSSTANLAFTTNDVERARIDSSGRLLVGTSTSAIIGSSTAGKFQLADTNAAIATLGTYANNGNGSVFVLGKSRSSGPSTYVIVQSGDLLGSLRFAGDDGTDYITQAANIEAYVDGTPGANDMPGRLVFSTTADGASSPTERMRIVSDGTTLISKTASSIATAGTEIGGGAVWTTRSAATAMRVNRLTDDGTLVEFLQDSVAEGTISVSGTTVSYNGAHLSRWSQLPTGAERTEILRGTVLSNIDEMCEWGEEDNEQLNRMKVSDVEGDKNVSGVFQAWDDDDDTYTNDFYCAMTGDFIIRIGAGVTVERGDLLMSAGDGTAKPQDDDIIRSKTIAKVTSTTVSCTHPDGSYCVPCVLMAC